MLLQLAGGVNLIFLDRRALSTLQKIIIAVVLIIAIEGAA